MATSTLSGAPQNQADDYSDFTVSQTDAESAPLESSGYEDFLPEAARANGYATTTPNLDSGGSLN